MVFTSPPIDQHPNSRRASELPVPDRQAQEHSRELTEYIRAQITDPQHGIPFREFMQLALYAPGLGYYSAGSEKLGAAGDFVTAPEISPLFAACLARAFAPVLEDIPAGNLLEVGAGSGQLAAGVLQHLQQLNCLPARYFILELSGELRARQRDTLTQACPTMLDRVVWLDTLPNDFDGIVFANELLDAMPVNRFVFHAAGAKEMYVSWQANQFHWLEGEPSDKELLGRIADINEQTGTLLTEGYCSEINFSAERWLHSIAQRLQRGVVLLIDYGFPRREFYHPQRDSGTLMCHYRHRAHGDPFVYPGLQDITAHVDFSAIATAGDRAGLQLLGYTNQANFLIGSGLTELAAQVNPLDTRAQLETAAQLKKLTLPHEMGELFKVIGFGKDINSELAGFRVRDLSAAL